MRNIFLALLVALCCAACGETLCDKEATARLFNYPVSIDGPLEWQEAEARHAKLLLEAGITPEKPFGRRNAEWEELKQSIRPGDCLFHYRSDEESWNNLSGREGYILIRRGKPIAGVLVRMS